MSRVEDRNGRRAVIDDGHAVIVVVIVVVIIIIIIVIAASAEDDDDGFVAFEALVIASHLDVDGGGLLPESQSYVVRQALVILALPRRAFDGEPDPDGSEPITALAADGELGVIGGRFAGGVVTRLDGDDDLGDRGGAKRQQRESAAERAGKAPQIGAMWDAKRSARHGSELVLHVLYSPFRTRALSSPQADFLLFS